MAAPDAVCYRLADAGDAPAIAALHADSWRRHYRGAYADSYLDGDVVADRLEVWSERLSQPDHRTFTWVAECTGRLVGFIHTVLDAEERWGALIDNLHVTTERKGEGIGTRLLSAAAEVLLERRPSSGLFLWVLEQNRAAQAFYRARHAAYVERAPVQAPGGDATRLHGAPAKLRYVWPDPSVLLSSVDRERWSPSE
jgi:ribosomal protein S18 acetylase RimI-like enzyme